MTRIRDLLDRKDFETLFLEELGWDRVEDPDSMVVSDDALGGNQLRSIANKRGVQVWHCTCKPDSRVRQRLDREAARRSAERLLIFADDKEHLWLWPERRPSGGTRHVVHTYRPGEPNPSLEQRIRRISFDFEEESNLSTLTVRERVRTAFNAEKITNRFYKDITRQRQKLAASIQGLADDKARELYASILLDRLIFLYFIQQKGFLDNDQEYLASRLHMVREWQGPDRFFGFYRDFLVPLFHQALGSPEPEYPDVKTREVIGDVPYVNGGLFLEITLERDYTINVPDTAFEDVLRTFNLYRWHLDERPTGDPNEINPEVLGYILEQYINQKEMGAYYTADDITGYMCGVTIAGRFLDRMNDASIWVMLQQDPERYIHDAMQHGAYDFDRFPLTLKPPAWIGSEWEEDASSEVGLPTEKLRETAHRVLAFRDIKRRIRSGEIGDVDAAVTANLNLVQLALDWLSKQSSPTTLLTAWQTLATFKVLDPTCGSGAFLLAAMKVLEELYEAVFEGIRHHVEGSSSPVPYLDTIVSDSEGNSAYFLRKSIALHNLYGVDILEEAVEIARLRLFLALVATVDQRERLEPLPDLDMNIRCGNILVGCVSTEDLQSVHEGDWVVADTVVVLKEQAVNLRDIYRRFQDAQRAEHRAEVLEWKRKLQTGTDKLRDQLDHLYSGSDNQVAGWDFTEWRRTHQPFHWIAEFPEAVLEGGFDVVVGNPPFVGSKKVREEKYSFHGFASDSAPDIYAPCLERAAHMVVDGGRLAMIAPISLVRGSEKGFMQLRRSLESSLPTRWFSVYSLRPDKLFNAGVRPAILIGHTGSSNDVKISSSNLRIWRSEYKEYLFETIMYSKCCPDRAFQLAWPMIGDPVASDLLKTLSASGKSLGNYVRKHGKFKVGRKTSVNLRFIAVFLQEPPCWTNENGSPGQRVIQTEVVWQGFEDELHQKAAFLIGAGRLGYWLWTTIGDAYHVTNKMVEWYPCDLELLRPIADDIILLAHELSQQMLNVQTANSRNNKFIGGYNLSACRDLTDKSDQLIMKHLGVGDYWSTLLALDNRIVKSNDGSPTSQNHWKAWTPTYGPWDPSMPE